MKWSGSQDSVVSVGTCYGLDGLRFDLLLGWDFSNPSTLALRPTWPPHDGYWLSFPRVKQPGTGVDLSSAKLTMGTAIPLPPRSASLACHAIALVFSQGGHYLWDIIIYQGYYYKNKTFLKLLLLPSRARVEAKSVGSVGRSWSQSLTLPLSLGEVSATNSFW